MSTRKKVFSGIFALAVLAAVGFMAFQANRGSRADTQKGPPAVPVSTVAVALKSVPVRLQAIGNVEPYTTVAVKARVDGQIVSVHFKEGDEVRQGAVLFEIDPRPFAAALKQAQANLLKDKALLDRANEQEKRYKDLLAKNFISADAYEQVRTNAQTAAATVAGDEAAIESAKLSLDYCTIRSPVTGYAGRIQIQQGNLVKANDTNPLVTINQVVPIYTSFSIPEQNIADIRKYQANGELKVQATFANASHAPIAGKLSFLDNSADTTTGTIKLKAEFPNTDKALWPGQFVNVALTLHEQQDAVVTPSAAVQNGPNGQYVFVIKPDLTAELRNIKVTRAEGDDTVVASGLQPGDQVVTVGQVRLAPGTKVSVAKPAMTLLVMIGILAFGLVAYRLLPVNSLPNVDFPSIQVQAQLPGANPETMASAVATPLEKQFSTIAGIDTMTSVSTSGQTTILLQFSLDRNIDGAAQDVQSAIAAAARSLPSSLPNPPTQRKVNPADFPVLLLALTSETRPLSVVDDYGENLLAQRISTINGVAQVQVYGSQQYAVRIQLDPNQLASRGIALTDIEQAIGNANVNIPTGTLYGRDKATAVQATGQISNAAGYEPIIVAYRNGAPVRLGQVARVFDSVQNDKVAAWYNGTRGVVLAVQRQPGTNTIEIVDSVKRILPTFEAQLPPSIQLQVLYDRSQSIRESVRDVQLTLLLALVLVVGVIFVFLRSLSATLIPSLALPLSIIGTFSVMYGFSYSLDNLSLMALTLCVGFVVDDAIVMLENITRHMEMGKSRLQATLDGSKEIGFTIVSMTLSLAAVFIPVLFMGGILGRLLKEFAVTIIVAVLISGFVSLTLTPLLCSRWLKIEREQHHGRIYAFSERVFEAMLAAYRGSLAWSLRNRRFTIVAFFAIVIGTGFFFYYMPKGFLPS